MHWVTECCDSEFKFFEETSLHVVCSEQLPASISTALLELPTQFNGRTLSGLLNE